MFTLNIGPCYRRSTHIEPLERPDLDDEELSRAFDFIEFLNRWTGGNRIVVDALAACSHRWMPGQTISILDVGCRRGDLTRAIVKWARSRQIDVKIFAIEKFSRFIQMAKEHSTGYPEINFDVRLLNDPMFLQAQQFDYVVSSLSLHELSFEQASVALKKMNLLAKRGLIVTDWIRDFRGWLWMSAFSFLLGNDVVREGAPLAVKKGFTESEIRHICRHAGVDYLNYSKHLGYRFSVMGERGLAMNPAYIPVAGLAT